MKEKRIFAGLLAFLLLGAFGLCAVGGEEGEDNPINIVLEILKSDDQEMQTAAIAMVKDMEGAEVTKALARELPGLSAASQVQLLAVLGDRGDKAAIDAVIAATKAADSAVREGALKALGQLGDASTVMMLADVAAATRGDEQKAARESLYRLRGEGVDEAIIKGIGKAEANTRVELITSLGERNVYAGVATLLKTAKDEDRKVRVESFKVLAAIAKPENLDALVDLLINVKSPSDRTEGEKAVAAVAHKIAKKDQQAAAVLAKLPSVKDIKARCSLLIALGRIGDDSALAVLRKGLSGKEADEQAAAIRALSMWPTGEPVADLQAAAQGSKIQLHKILALRGFVRLLGLESKRPASETIAMYRQAMSLAPDAMEKRRVISGLSSTASVDSLTMAAEYLADKELFREAEVAVVRIAEGICKEHPQESKDMLKRVISSTKSDSVLKQAEEVIKVIDGKEDDNEDEAG
jgi:HEAT repeat protein